MRVGDLTNFLSRLIICCLLENYWVNPFPGASFGINHFFSYIAQAMVAAFDQNSLDHLLQLLKTAGDNTAMPSLTAPVQILCYFLVQITAWASHPRSCSSSTAAPSSCMASRLCSARSSCRC